MWFETFPHCLLPPKVFGCLPPVPAVGGRGETRACAGVLRSSRAFPLAGGGAGRAPRRGSGGQSCTPRRALSQMAGLCCFRCARLQDGPSPRALPASRVPKVRALFFWIAAGKGKGRGRLGTAWGVGLWGGGREVCLKGGRGQRLGGIKAGSPAHPRLPERDCRKQGIQTSKKTGSGGGRGRNEDGKIPKGSARRSRDSGCPAAEEENQETKRSGLTVLTQRPRPPTVIRRSGESFCVGAEGTFSLHHVGPLGFHPGNASSSIRPAPAWPLSVICLGRPPEGPPSASIHLPRSPRINLPWGELPPATRGALTFGNFPKLLEPSVKGYFLPHLR